MKVGGDGRKISPGDSRSKGKQIAGIPTGRSVPNRSTPMFGGTAGAPMSPGMGYPSAGSMPGPAGISPGAMPMPPGMAALGMAAPGMSTGMPPGGIPQGGAPSGMPTAMSGGMPPTMPQGMPPGLGLDSGPVPGLAPSPGGSIRNNLGAGLKSRGVFQKDGKINNSRGGLLGGGGGKMGTGPFAFLGSGGPPGMAQPRQLILEPVHAGIAANGIATISPDNVFTCIANLPPPNTFIAQGFGTYAVYLVDGKGQTGFLAGILRPVGNGAYQMQFRSQVPLAHYSRVMITVENPQQLGHVPQGPVVLQVKQPLGPTRFFTPVKKVGGSVWKKLTGLIKGKPKVPAMPEGGGITPDLGVPPSTMEPPAGNLPVGNPPMGNLPVGSPPMGNPPVQ